MQAVGNSRQLQNHDRETDAPAFGNPEVPLERRTLIGYWSFSREAARHLQLDQYSQTRLICAVWKR